MLTGAPISYYIGEIRTDIVGAVEPRLARLKAVARFYASVAPSESTLGCPPA